MEKLCRAEVPKRLGAGFPKAFSQLSFMTRFETSEKGPLDAIGMYPYDELSAKQMYDWLVGICGGMISPKALICIVRSVL